MMLYIKTNTSYWSYATRCEIPQGNVLPLLSTLYLHSGQSYMVVVCSSKKEYTLNYFLKYATEVRKKASSLSSTGDALAPVLPSYGFLRIAMSVSCLHVQYLL